MAKLEIFQIPALFDNYIYVLREPESEIVGVVDPSEPEPVLNFLSSRGWELNLILNTHHHLDHVGGNRILKEKTGARIFGPEPDRKRIPGIDQTYRDGELIEVGTEKARAFFIPGHTLGHMALWFENTGALFSGDTLFSLGCGRLFEGTPEQMWESLRRLRELPKETKIYCGHEYTQKNAEFALTLEGKNEKLKDYYDRILKKRKENLSTIPSLLEEELDCNPFLRPESLEIRKNLRMEDHTNLEVFAEIRRRKDSF